MVNLLQYQSTVSNPTHMWVNGGSNCRSFWDKHLFYILFVRPNYVHVARGSTLLAAGMVLVPLILPGYPKI